MVKAEAVVLGWEMVEIPSVNLCIHTFENRKIMFLVESE